MQPVIINDGDVQTPEQPMPVEPSQGSGGIVPGHAPPTNDGGQAPAITPMGDDRTPKPAGPEGTVDDGNVDGDFHSAVTEAAPNNPDETNPDAGFTGLAWFAIAAFTFTCVLAIIRARHWHRASEIGHESGHESETALLIPVQPPIAVYPQQSSVWVCPKCTLENAATNTRCDACGGNAAPVLSLASAPPVTSSVPVMPFVAPLQMPPMTAASQPSLYPAYYVRPGSLA
jgi:hypothetical protein